MESQFDTQRSVLDKNKEGPLIRKSTIEVSPQQLAPSEKSLENLLLEQQESLVAIQIIYAILANGQRFFDNEIYRFLDQIIQKNQSMIDIGHLNDIFSKTSLSNAEIAVICKNFSPSRLNSQARDFDFDSFDFKSLGISPIKLKRLESEFRKLYPKKDGKHIYQELKKLLHTKFKENINEKDAEILLNELDYRNEHSITFQSILSALTTKKGLLALINLRRIIKGVLNQSKSLKIPAYKLIEFVTASNFITNDINENAFYDLIESYELLDVESDGILNKDFLIKNLRGLRKHFSPREKQICLYFQKLLGEHIYFKDFYNLFLGPLKRKNIKTQEIKEVAYKLSKKSLIF